VALLPTHKFTANSLVDKQIINTPIEEVKSS